MTQIPTPGYQPAPPKDASRAEVRPAGGVARVLVSLLVAAAVTSLASGLASLYRAGAIDAYLAGNGSRSSLSTADTAAGVAGIADLLVFLATAVYFLVWSWRVFKNARLIAPSAAPAAGWSIGGWFIPVANLVLPAYFLSRVDRVSGDHSRDARRLIIGWAVLYGVANALSRVIWRRTDDTLESLLTADQRDIWAQLLYAAAAVLAILMVRAVTARQEHALVELQERRQAEAGSRDAAARSAPLGYHAPIDRTVGQNPPRPTEDPPPR